MTPETKRVLNAVSAVSRIPVQAIMSRSRHRLTTQARQVAQFLLVMDIGRSGNSVAAEFGRDHSTVSSGIDATLQDLHRGGPRGEIVKAVRAMLDAKAQIKPYGKAPVVPLHLGVVSKTAKRITKCGWVEADGSLVVAP